MITSVDWWGAILHAVNDPVFGWFILPALVLLTEIVLLFGLVVD